MQFFQTISLYLFQRNRTALDCAKERGHKEILALLGKQNISNIS